MRPIPNMTKIFADPPPLDPISTLQTQESPRPAPPPRAGKGHGFDAWGYPPVGLLIVRSDSGVGTFDFDRQKPGINSEAVTISPSLEAFWKSRCWRKV